MSDEQTSRAADSPLVLCVEPSGTTGLLMLRVTPAYAQDLRERLNAEGLHVSDVIELSVVDEVLQPVATLLGAVGAAGLSAVIVAFLHRHRGKRARLTIAGKSVDLEGYSTRDIKRLTKLVADADAEHREGWRRALEDRPDQQVPDEQEPAP